jgi:hypothetical protein
MLGIEPQVTLVNRLVDRQGKPIPYEFVFDAIGYTLIDKLTVPVGAARIIVHNSMYRVGQSGTEYKLGVPEWDLPCDPITPDDLSDELIDRAELGYPRQTIKGTVLKKGAPLRNVVKRQDPLSVANPRDKDGAFPGFYGESK